MQTAKQSNVISSNIIIRALFNSTRIKEHRSPNEDRPCLVVYECNSVGAMITTIQVSSDYILKIICLPVHVCQLTTEDGLALRRIFLHYIERGS